MKPHMTIEWDGEAISISCEPRMPPKIQEYLLTVASHMVTMNQDRLYISDVDDEQPVKRLCKVLQFSKSRPAQRDK